MQIRQFVVTASQPFSYGFHCPVLLALSMPAHGMRNGRGRSTIDAYPPRVDGVIVFGIFRPATAARNI